MGFIEIICIISAVWLLLMAIIMTTENFQSFVIFKLLPAALAILNVISVFKIMTQ